LAGGGARALLTCRGNGGCVCACVPLPGEASTFRRRRGNRRRSFCEAARNFRRDQPYASRREYGPGGAANQLLPDFTFRLSNQEVEGLTQIDLKPAAGAPPLRFH
jgi:hypothetical protein